MSEPSNDATPEHEPGRDTTAEAETWSGRCLCGGIELRIAARPRQVHFCHCGMCRRATGAAAAVLVWAPRSSVSWRGAPARYRSSSVSERGFCGRCGSPLFLQYDRSAEIAILAGVLDAPERLRPTHHYGAESMLPWNDPPDGLPRYCTDLNDPLLVGLVPTGPAAKE